MTSDEISPESESRNQIAGGTHRSGFDIISSFVIRHSSFLTTLSATLGLLLRAYHYGRNPSMWHDEAATSVNVLHKSFAGLFGHLDYSATGPSLLLCIQKYGVLLLGDSTYSLRLISFLASCAALLLMVKLARALFDPPGAFCATLLAACSDRLLWHASEARHYSSDFLIAVVLLLLFVKTADWPLMRRLALFALCAPFAILLSYPGVFLCGGLLLAVLPEVRKDGRAAAWAGWLLLGAVVTASFAFFYFYTIKAQRSAEMDAIWLKEFPDLRKPWKLPFWALSATVSIVDYYVRPYAGGILTATAVVGAVIFWREKRRGLLILIAAPMVFAMLAALVKSYPYTGARTMVYCLPGLTLLIAAGMPPGFRWLTTRLPALPARILVCLFLFPIAAEVALALYTVAVPWKRADSAGASAFVLAHRQPGDFITANHWEFEYYFRNLGPVFSPDLESSSTCAAAGQHRLWLVLEAATPEERTRLSNAVISQGWHVDDEHEFQNASVFLLSRTGQN
jgi:uncharacterized membrane protein